MTLTMDASPAAPSCAPAPSAAAEKVLVGLIGSGIGLSLTPAMHEQEARVSRVHVGSTVREVVLPVVKRGVGGPAGG